MTCKCANDGCTCTYGIENIKCNFKKNDRCDECYGVAKEIQNEFFKKFK